MNLLHDDSGQTMAEYGLLLAIIALVVIVAATILGTNISSVFHKTCQAFGTPSVFTCASH